MPDMTYGIGYEYPRRQGSTYPSTNAVQGVIVPRMERAFVDRIRERLDVTGKSVRRASLDAGMSETALKDLLANPKQYPKLDTIEKLAESLEADPAWLAFGVGDDVRKAKEETAERVGQLMPVLGEVAAGRWLEVEQNADTSKYEPAPITPDPSYRKEAQYGLVVRGTSLNLYAADGDILHCLDIAQSGRMPTTGELVIVEQIRDGGFLRERTAKAYHVGEGDTVELRAFSDDPRWDQPIFIPHRVYSHVIEKGLVIEIVAVVLGAYKPMPKVPRR